MQILRGNSGASRRRIGFFNPTLAAHHTRLRRLQRKGLTPPGDKASLRALADAAAQSHPITKV